MKWMKMRSLLPAFPGVKAIVFTKPKEVVEEGGIGGRRVFFSREKSFYFGKVCLHWSIFFTVGKHVCTTANETFFEASKAIVEWWWGVGLVTFFVSKSAVNWAAIPSETLVLDYVCNLNAAKYRINSSWRKCTSTDYESWIIKLEDEVCGRCSRSLWGTHLFGTLRNTNENATFLCIIQAAGDDVFPLCQVLLHVFQALELGAAGIEQSNRSQSSVHF